jgi:hypothetical protein
LSAIILSSVVVNDLDVFEASIGPTKADPPLVVDTDAVLPYPITFQGLEAVSWWHAQRVERRRGIQ